MKIDVAVQSYRKPESLIYTLFSLHRHSRDAIDTVWINDDRSGGDVIEQDVAALGFAIPGMVKDSVAQQVPVSIGSSLRDFGYPMTDAIYGQKAFALHSLTHNVPICQMKGDEVLGTTSS